MLPPNSPLISWAVNLLTPRNPLCQKDCPKKWPILTRLVAVYEMWPNELLVRRDRRLALGIVLNGGRVQGQLLGDKGQEVPQDF